jgi:hypothetical protein
VNLLDGTFSNQTFQVGANSTSNDKITIGAIASAKANSLGVGSGSSYSSSLAGSQYNKCNRRWQSAINGVSIAQALLMAYLSKIPQVAQLLRLQPSMHQQAALASLQLLRRQLLLVPQQQVLRQRLPLVTSK